MMKSDPELPLVFSRPMPLTSAPSSWLLAQLSTLVASAIAIALPAARTFGTWVRNVRIAGSELHDGAPWFIHSQPKLLLISLPAWISASVTLQNTASDGTNVPLVQLVA